MLQHSQKKYRNILKACHDKTGHLKMLVESLCIYTCIYIVGIKYKSHNNQCPLIQDYRYKILFYDFGLS